ncbi:hypothetical protein K7R09_20965 [Serratia ureilytica]|uniref:Apea-like HEPN domain-containing protein n=1 Tax=Serratia ureilytica TaxID=300181 RepID=A0ABU0VPI1_9GAMM|nr:hypothetical protein [Serratia ureilytica]MCU7064279.1 hypothetical protein [Serratia ureilytica]MDQ1806655.1 hypothetical protein [Serratia ureilytica]MDQ1835712.1 hypothetical protein [Serratia ureilytica]MDQ1862865.1 hypothetical protein [Serratia ureilytica]
MSSVISVYFLETKNTNMEMGEFFNFSWASYAGLRELWWQTRGLAVCFPTMSLEDITAKLMSGMTLPGGVDLNSLALEKEWVEHEKKFASNLIFNACTMLETWLEKICTYSIPKKQRNWVVKALQCPDLVIKPNADYKSYLDVVAYINSIKSTFMHAEFFPFIQRNKMNSWGRINSLLKAYTYFKSIRNNLVHSSGVVDATIINKLNELKSDISTNGGSLRRELILPSQIMGKPIDINMSDAISLYSIIKCMMFTYDAMLCTTNDSEKFLAERCRKAVEIKRHATYRIPSNTRKKERVLRKILNNAVLPTDINKMNFHQWLLSNNIVTN